MLPNAPQNAGRGSIAVFAFTFEDRKVERMSIGVRRIGWHSNFIGLQIGKPPSVVVAAASEQEVLRD